MPTNSLTVNRHSKETQRTSSTQVPPTPDDFGDATIRQTRSKTSTQRKVVQMAKKVTIEISDDTDGSRANQTVPFGLDGVSYEIDLSNANAGTLRAAMEPYVTVARRTGGRRIKVAVGQPTDSTKQEPKTSTDYTAAHDIRAWAQKNGYEVADQGRISKSVVEAFHSSRQDSNPETTQEPRITTKPKRRTRRSK
jgi:hypothetical protein